MLIDIFDRELLRAYFATGIIDPTDHLLRTVDGYQYSGPARNDEDMLRAACGPHAKRLLQARVSAAEKYSSKFQWLSALQDAVSLLMKIYLTDAVAIASAAEASYETLRHRTTQTVCAATVGFLGERETIALFLPITSKLLRGAAVMLGNGLC